MPARPPRAESGGSAAEVLARWPQALANGDPALPAHPVPRSDVPSAPDDGSARRPRRLAWSDLLRRVFAIDVLACPRCGDRMRILAAIHPPETTEAILDCLGLPSRAPPAAPPAPDEMAEGAGWEPGFDAGG